MPHFLYTAKNSRGNTITDYIESKNLTFARIELEKYGYNTIVFHNGDNSELEGIFDNKEVKPPGYTPEMHMTNLRSNSILHAILFGIKTTAVLWTPLLFWVSLCLWKGPPFGIIAITGFILCFWFLIFFIWLVFPTVSYYLINEAYIWAKWNKVRIYADLIKVVNTIHNVKINEWDVDMKVAYSYASEGNQQEAFKLIYQYEVRSDIPKGLLYGRLASVYGAMKDYNKMTECHLRALELGSGDAPFVIDYAMTLVTRYKNTIKARELLLSIHGKELSIISSAFLFLCKGIITLEEYNFIESQVYLYKALEIISVYKHNKLFIGFIMDIKTYLVIVLGSIGEKQKAKLLFKEIKYFLEVHKKEELINRCQIAID